MAFDGAEDGDEVARRHADGVERLHQLAEAYAFVENVEQAEFLVENGCHIAQGFLYSRPIAALDILPWLEALRMDKTGVFMPVLSTTGARSLRKV